MRHVKNTVRNRIFYLGIDNRIWEVDSKKQVPANAIITIMAREPSDAARNIERKLKRREMFSAKSEMNR